MKENDKKKRMKRKRLYGRMHTRTHAHTPNSSQFYLSLKFKTHFSMLMRQSVSERKSPFTFSHSYFNVEIVFEEKKPLTQFAQAVKRFWYSRESSQKPKVVQRSGKGVSKWRNENRSGIVMKFSTLDFNTLKIIKFV